MPTIREMRETCQLRKYNTKGELVWAGHWLNRLIVRRFSIYITWFFVKLKISANQVTLLMMVFGLTGFCFSIPHLLLLNIAGAAFLLLAEFLDCVDGEVARWSRKSSLKGLYLDLVNHVVCNALTAAICGLHLYILTKQSKYLILAFLAYAMAQIRLGLGKEFRHILCLIPQEHKVNKQNVVYITPKSFISKNLSIVKWLLHRSVDEYLVTIATVIAIVLTHAGFQLPAIALTWWLVFFGLINNLGEVANKYYFCIPDAAHVKKIVNAAPCTPGADHRI